MAPAQKHRERLIAASAALFRSKGYAATGLAEILAASGAPKGSLYHYFPLGKESLGVAALQAAAAQMGAAMQQAAAASGGPAAVIRHWGAVSAANLAASGYSQGCPIATVALEVAAESDAMCAAARAAFDGWARLLARLLRDAGVERARADALADFAISACEGALILARVRRAPDAILAAVEEVARAFEREIALNPTQSRSEP